jgi:DNA adenine methylase
VNKSNRFNAPFGKYKNPRICDEDNLRACSSSLQNVRILHRYFDSLRPEVGNGDFVYFDPPYVPISVTSNFTSYTNQGFGSLEQTILRDMAQELKERGVNVLLSNSDHVWVRDLYKDFSIRGISVGRAISCKGDRRQAVGEVLIS